jgi:hypothetical protein
MRIRPPSALVVVIALAAACAPAMRSSIAGTPTPEQMAELWIRPGDITHRDLIYGPDGRAHAPDPAAIYTLVKEENGGFSRKIEVEDPAGQKWHVKLGPEAQPEVVSSRIVWAMGYHQPPDYYLPVWRMKDKSGRQLDMPPARFLARKSGLEDKGSWLWHHNPFVDTQPFRGLLALMMVLNSTDLKDENNKLYELHAPREKARQWYVVKDLGATLGETGRVDPLRGNPEAFERTGFITRVTENRVFFDFKGRHQELLTVVRPSDVAWMCNELARMTPSAWRDVFRAGGYNDQDAARFITKIQDKIAQGRALAARGDR